jgi:hypothetical protein
MVDPSRTLKLLELRICFRACFRFGPVPARHQRTVVSPVFEDPGGPDPAQFGVNPIVPASCAPQT